MDRLDQLFARSQREIEAHAEESADTEAGRYFINEAAQLLAALRLWAQSNAAAIRQFGRSSKPVTSLRSETLAESCGSWEPRTRRPPAGPCKRSRRCRQSSSRPSLPTPSEPCDIAWNPGGDTASPGICWRRPGKARQPVGH